MGYNCRDIRGSCEMGGRFHITVLPIPTPIAALDLVILSEASPTVVWRRGRGEERAPVTARRVNHLGNVALRLTVYKLRTEKLAELRRMWPFLGAFFGRNV